MNNVLVSFHPAVADPTVTQPGCGGQPASEYSDTIVLPWNDLECLRAEFQRAGDQICAVIMEPLLANSGSCEPREGFLAAVIDLCRQNGAISIFDEVITGFRLASGGAREYYGVNPDLSVYGKAFAGGFPMSAVAGRMEMFDVLRDGRTFHAGTYNGNPICLAAASATLEVLSQPDTYSRMHTHGKQLQEAIRSKAKACGKQLAICGAGTIFNVHWGVASAPTDYRETLKSDSSANARFRLAMLDEGVYLLPDGRWYVGAAHDAVALEWAVNAIKSSIEQMDQAHVDG
jgi:glutamate-1-semialdehyde 2,1-aminomutase